MKNEKIIFTIYVGEYYTHTIEANDMSEAVKKFMEEEGGDDALLLEEYGDGIIKVEIYSEEELDEKDEKEKSDSVSNSKEYEIEIEKSAQIEIKATNKNEALKKFNSEHGSPEDYLYEWGEISWGIVPHSEDEEELY